MTAATVTMERDKRGIATVTIDRPGALNAFDGDQMDAFNAALVEVGAMDGLRAVVIAGAGKVFCAGADVAYLRNMGAKPWDENVAASRRYAAMSQTLRQLPAPVIARVQGGAFGGGISLLAACDIVLAERSAKFAVTEGKFGFTASIMMPYLLPRIGMRQARRWCMTAEVMDCATAARIGLVDEIAEDGALDVVLEGLLDHILHNGPSGVAETKKAVNRLSFPVFNQKTVDRTVEAFSKGRASDAAREGAAAFAEKRKPSWAR